MVEEYKIKEWQIVGEFAKKLFPNGVNIPIEDYSENLQKTKEVLNKTKTLFEAGFEFRNCFSRVDILVLVGDEWDLIEVKSSKRVKDINVHDVAFQKYVIESSELKIRKCFLMHLSDEYVRKGELEELFIKEDISEQVDQLLVDIEENISSIFELIKEKDEPQPGIIHPRIIKNGNHNCLRDNCINITENSVFNLYRGKKLACKLFKEGIETLGDIPEECVLTEKQNIQRECKQQNKIHINKELINKFLAQLQYPLYYLDFETISTAIPMFDDLTPYAIVPFQYSLHRLREEGAELEHYEYLYDSCEDPRKEFIEELQNVLGESSSIVVYNKSFEIKRLEELAEFLPEHKKWVSSTVARIVDLLVPFRNFYYYNPKQKGSASIKAVLPAIVGKSYDDLDIAEGMTASIEFLRITYDDCDPAEKEKIREQLLTYCELDTLAQVNIVDELKELVM
ncbi:MAG: DUF2779 domain-containing protein [Candidatus Heimdallarchaeota archaeon]